MARADQKPGRRRAVSEPRRKRVTSKARRARPTASGVNGSARSPAPTAQITEPQALAGREKPGFWRRLLPTVGQLVAALWFLLVLAATAALGLGWSPVPTPAWLPVAGAVTITTLFTSGLAARTGGRAVISGAMALLLSVAAVLSGLPVLAAAAAMGTVVVSAVLAVMATKPAAGFIVVVRECVIAVLIAGIGAFAAEAYQAEVSAERFGYLSLGLALLAAVVLVYRLGAGLQGVGRRGLVMLVSGLVLLMVTLAYTEALTRWGSPALETSIEDLAEMMRSTVGAVPRPAEFLLGIPALAWGVSTRARRRQGWWVCAFGAAGMVGVSSSLVDPMMSLVEAGLSVVYSTLIGLLLGYLVIRADKFLTGARGRRARRLEVASAGRPEPGRVQALL